MQTNAENVTIVTNWNEHDEMDERKKFTILNESTDSAMGSVPRSIENEQSKAMHVWNDFSVYLLDTINENNAINARQVKRIAALESPMSQNYAVEYYQTQRSQ